jgi:hypothetical protein
MAGATPNRLWFLIILFLALKHRKVTSDVNWLQNTSFFFKKYEVPRILFANHSAHTSNNKIIFSTEKAKPSVRRGRKAAGLSRDGRAAAGGILISSVFYFYPYKGKRR